MVREMITFRDFGHASALAVLLFVAVLPIGILSVRSMVRQGVVQ
jgi:ABC-type sugar transport system permease subunit